MELEHMEERTERQTANSEHRVANIGNKQRQTMASSDCGLSPNATWRRPSHVSVGSWRLLLLLWHGGCHLLAENSTLAFLIQTHIRRSTCIRIGEWGARTRGKCHSLNWKNNARIWPTASKVDDDGHDDGNVDGAQRVAAFRQRKYLSPPHENVKGHGPFHARAKI